MPLKRFGTLETTRTQRPGRRYIEINNSVLYGRRDGQKLCPSYGHFGETAEIWHTRCVIAFSPHMIVVKTFSLDVVILKGCPLSLILFVIFTDRISRHSQGKKSVQVRNIRLHCCFLQMILLCLPHQLWPAAHSWVVCNHI